MRKRNGLPPFDDPPLDERPNAFLLARELLS
jgi:hypothetical protein